ncbi:MAG: hypothetical protein IJF02_03660 [Oscillospiraceae bacterium]|nr:hypothetical protein [Oscillospiraceae bacterium]
MAWIRSYMLRLICAAVLCGIINRLTGKKGALGTTIKLMTGIFMIFCFVSPWVDMQIGDISGFFGDVSVSADSAVASGEKDAQDALQAIIKSKTEAYILDKAKSFGAELSVEVRVDGSELPVPCTVLIKGSISPYGKKQLSSIIADELGVALEDQLWTG